MAATKGVEEKVREKVERIIADDPDLFVVDVILKGNHGNQKLIVLLDGDEGVNIDQCSKVSRSLSADLEEEDLIDGKYLLEVSSAGLDFPLTTLRQYKKNIGRSLKVTLSSGDQLEGELTQVDEATIVLQKKVKKNFEQHEIKLQDINKSMVLVSFK